MNDRKKHLCLTMTAAAVAAIVFLLLYWLMPTPLLPLAVL